VIFNRTQASTSELPIDLGPCSLGERQPAREKIPCATAFCVYQLPLFLDGWVAQLVEQRTENPCVAGSIPASATTSRIVNINNGLVHV
jgi:hypothetical protein